MKKKQLLFIFLIISPFVALAYPKSDVDGKNITINNNTVVVPSEANNCVCDANSIVDHCDKISF